LRRKVKSKGDEQAIAAHEGISERIKVAAVIVN
jgi:hypothetical protein